MINYTKKTWKDEPDHTTPITAYELNQREQAFENLATQKLDISQTQNLTGLQKSVAIANLGLPDGMHFIGYVETTEDLPTDAHNGDYYEVREDGHTYIWNGEEWVDRGVEGTSNVVKYVPQTLTSAEKSQARNNIGAGTSSFSGNYNDLSNKPTLATVATSGNYNDLSNKPSIPTKTSDLTNDSNYVSDANYVHTDNNYTSAEKTSVGQITGIKNDLSQLTDEVGRNLWDEEWEVISSTKIQNKNCINVLPNTVYYIAYPEYGYGAEIYFYDANDSLLSTSEFLRNSTFTTPANCAYIFFLTHNSYGATYNHDICINRSDLQNGTYTPFRGLRKQISEVSTEALDIKMLGWSVPKECPIQNYMDSNRVFHQRVGRIDLGSLNWAYSSTPAAGNPFFFSTIGNMKDLTKNLYLINYIVETSAGLWMTLDKAIKASYPYHNYEINIRDSSYTDASTFKAAMQGVYLYYELANEIVSDIDGNEAVTEVRSIYPSEHSSSTPYSYGDLAFHNGELYEYTNSTASSGAWNPNYWTKVTLGNMAFLKYTVISTF